MSQSKVKYVLNKKTLAIKLSICDNYYLKKGDFLLETHNKIYKKMSNFFSKLFSNSSNDVKDSILNIKIVNDKEMIAAAQTILKDIIKGVPNDPALIIALSKMHFLNEMSSKIEYQYFSSNINNSQNLKKLIDQTAVYIMNFQVYERVFSELYTKMDSMQELKLVEVQKLCAELCKEIDSSLNTHI